MEASSSMRRELREMQRQIARRQITWMKGRAWLQGWSQEWPEAWLETRGVAMQVGWSRLPWAAAWTQEEAKAWAETEARVRAEAEAEANEQGAWVRQEAWARQERAERAEARVWAAAEALAVAGALAWAQGDARARGESAPAAVADPSTIKRILTSLHEYGVAHDLFYSWPRTRDEYSCLIHFIAPITRLPLELLRQILLIIINETSGPPLVFMLVCKRWHAIVTSIWASLNLTTTTPINTVTSKLERNQWLLDIVVDTEIDRGGVTPSDGAFDAIFAAIEASSRWRSLVVISFPGEADLPGHLVNQGLRRCSSATMSRFTSLKVKSTCKSSPLLNGLLRILGTTAGPELSTVEINSANVLSFLAPAYPSIFHSVKVLSLDTPQIPNPVDILPHLHQLETFTASHISFPTYHDDVNLPFVHTLRYLSLRAVSIQWMSGRTFPILEHCTIIFPLHRHVLHTFTTTLPNCKHLTFQGYPLEILGGVLAHNLTCLSVISSGPFNGRGNRQLVWLSRQVLGEGQLTPQILHISIEATNKTWVDALVFMSGLEELVIHIARPSSLGAKVFQSLVVQPAYASNLGATVTPRELDTPLCPSLRRLGLKYDRWLRPTERFNLIPILISIIQSRQDSNCSLESFRLWTTSDEPDPLELISRSRMSIKGFERLAMESGIEGGLSSYDVDASSSEDSGESFPDSPATSDD